MVKVWQIWPRVAQGLEITVFSYTVLMFLTVVFMNFVVDEAHQPLDFYSNKLRTRPYWLVIIVLALGGCAFAAYYTDRTKQLNENLPEIAIASYLQGLLLGVLEFARESAAAALTSTLLYTFVGATLVMVTLVPTVPMDRP